MAKFALLVTLSVVLGTTPKPLPSYQLPVTDNLDSILTGIKTVTGALPQIKAEIQDVTPEGGKPAYEASLQLTDGSFSLPTESVPFTMPATIEPVLAWLEGTSGEKPQVDLVMELIELPVAAAVTPAPEAA